MTHRISRRDFLRSSAAAGAGLSLTAPTLLPAAAPNEKVRLAAIGVGGKGWSDLNGAARFCEVIAFCDVDTGGKRRRGGYAAAAEKYPKARRYTDWRRLFDKEQGRIDAVTVSTPDHQHAPITMTALQHGLAVFTQKPLTRTVFEARAITQAAAKAGVSTQMGNQGHSGTGYRRVVELVRSGIVGKVKKAHTWSNRPIWPQGIDRPAGRDPVPAGLHWDLWLGGAPERPYKRGIYHPFRWRGWYDFGAGALGDMGCHIIDPAYWSLELSAPLSVSYDGPAPHAESFPKSEVLRYVFPGTQYTSGSTLELFWWDGGKKPGIKETHLPGDAKLPSQGVMLIGEKGTLVCPHGGVPRLYPEELNKQIRYKPLPGIDHYGIWIEGIRTGKAPNSSFAYAGPLTEVVLLGVVASRVGEGELKWDAEKLRFTNSDVANRYIREDYRKGWQVKGL